MKIKDYMTKGVICCDVEDDISTIAEIMNSNNIGFIAVLKDDEIVGVLTDRDIVIGPVLDNENSIEDFLNKNIISIEEDSSVNEGLRLMKENKVKRLLVTKKGKYTGVLSTSDLLNYDSTEELLNTLREIKD